jgi:hypothetical protein
VYNNGKQWMEVFEMRLALPSFDPVRDCQSCNAREEREVSAHILAYQIAYQLLMSVPGQIQVDGNRLILELNSHEPLHFDLRSGSLNSKSISIPLEQRYQPNKRLDELTREIKEELQISDSEIEQEINPIYTLLVKLVEIFHARCGLYIHSAQKQDDYTLWEIRLCEGGPSGWIQSNGIIRNRFGEEVSLDQWSHLRPEKLAAYVFGFNQFCKHYSSPVNSFNKAR